MSNVTVIESVEQFADFISQEKSVVNFTAPEWCGPCRQLEPRYEMAAAQTEIPFATVSPDLFPGLAAEYRVMGVPAVFLFEDGVTTGRITGRTAPAILSELE